MPNRVSFQVPDELDTLINAAPTRPPGPVTDDLRSIYVLGILAAVFEEMNRAQLAKDLINVNLEELKLG